MFAVLGSLQIDPMRDLMFSRVRVNQMGLPHLPVALGFYRMLILNCFAPVFDRLENAVFNNGLKNFPVKLGHKVPLLSMTPIPHSMRNILEVRQFPHPQAMGRVFPINKCFHLESMTAMVLDG